MHEKILVTGANGYIGRKVVDKLIEKGENVVAVDFALNEVNDKADKYESNIFCSDFSDVLNKTKPDVCVHLAWKDGFMHYSDAHLKHLYEHMNFIDKIIEFGVKHVLIMGTMHEIGYYEGEVNEYTPCNPTTPYGIAKNAFRQYVLNKYSDTDAYIQWIRAFYIYGDDLKNNSIFTKIVEAEKANKEFFPFVKGENKYDFINIDELANQISSTALQNEVIGIINCCTGNPVALKDQVIKFIKNNNFKIKLDAGKFPERKYDSPIIYGNTEKIKKIMDTVK